MLNIALSIFTGYILGVLTAGILLIKGNLKLKWELVILCLLISALAKITFEINYWLLNITGMLIMITIVFMAVRGEGDR